MISRDLYSILKQVNIVIFIKQANNFDAANDGYGSRKKTLLKQFSRWLIAAYGHSMGVSRALQECANDLDNVAIIAIPEFSGAGTNVRD